MRVCDWRCLSAIDAGAEAASNRTEKSIPWKKGESVPPSAWMPEGMWPYQFRDPSHLKMKELTGLLRKWRAEQDRGEGFRLTGFIDSAGVVQPARYNEYIERWQADAENRRARRKAELMVERRSSAEHFGDSGEKDSP